MRKAASRFSSQLLISVCIEALTLRAGGKGFPTELDSIRAQPAFQQAVSNPRPSGLAQRDLACSCREMAESPGSRSREFPKMLLSTRLHRTGNVRALSM